MLLPENHPRCLSVSYVVVLLLALLPPTIAAAEETTRVDSSEPGPRRMEHPIAIDGHIGVGTPLGFGGVSLDYSPGRWFGVMAGIGLGEIGPQYAIMPRVQFLFDGLGLHGAVGLSGGPDRWDEGFIAMMHGGSSKDSSFAFWANSHVGVDYQFDFQWRIGAYLGTALLLNPDSYECRDRSDTHCSIDHADDPGTAIYPYLGVSTGYAF